MRKYEISAKLIYGPKFVKKKPEFFQTPYVAY